MENSISQLSNLWNQVLTEIKEQLNSRTIFDSFFRDSYIASIEQKVMYVIANSSLAKQLITSKYLDFVQSVVLKITGTSYKLQILTKAEYDQIEHKTVKTDEKPADFFKNCKINPDFTFENFITGPSNKEACQAALVVASNRGDLYNPLFIYGESGIGKTHLLHSIGNYLRETEPQIKVLLFDTDAFVDEYMKAARGESDFNKFKEYIISFDVLLVDDIQFLVGKKKTEDAFFAIFKTFHDTGRQIVITCDRLPNDLDGLANRLVTRFNEGLPERINTPESDVCINFLKKKISDSGLNIAYFEEDALKFLAEKFSTSIRELQGAFNKLMYYTKIKNPNFIDLQTTIEGVGDLLKAKDLNNDVSEKRIINIVAEYFNLTPEQLIGNSHVKQITYARHIAMYLIKIILNASYKKIGYIFGGKDHSTVMSGVTKVENLLKTDIYLKGAVKDLKAKIS